MSYPQLSLTEYGGAYCNLSNCALTDASVRYDVPFFVRLEFFDRVHDALGLDALCLVDSAIRPRGYEPKDVVLGCDSPMRRIPLGAVNPHRIGLQKCVGPVIQHP